MPKPEKVEAVKQIAKRLKDADGALLTEYRGLKVEEMKELRRALNDIGTDFKVVKNSLTRLAVKDAKLEDLLPFLEGSTAIAFIKGDPVEAAKGLDEMAKKYPSLIVKGGIVEGKILDASQASSLAKVKPREVLLAQLAGMMQQPMQQLANLLSAPLRNLGYALGAYRDKVEQESPPAVAEQPAAEEPATEQPAAAEEQPAAEEQASAETQQETAEAQAEDESPEETPGQVVEEAPPVAEGEPAEAQPETPAEAPTETGAEAKSETPDDAQTETEEAADQGAEDKEE